jgi:hypothetical protein
MTDDDALLAELAEAEWAARQVPNRILTAGRAAFAWRTVDAELAQLTSDSATGPELAGAGSGTRAGSGTHRRLSFETDALTVEVEVAPEGLHGQVVPPQPGTVELQQQDGAASTAAVDDVGWFTFAIAPVHLFRLRLRTRDGGQVVTEWTTP